MHIVLPPGVEATVMVPDNAKKSMLNEKEVFLQDALILKSGKHDVEFALS